MAVVKTTRSIPELIGDVVNDFTVLVRKETELARVEMSEKIGDLGIACRRIGASDSRLGHTFAGGGGRISGRWNCVGLVRIDRRRRRGSDRVHFAGFWHQQAQIGTACSDSNHRPVRA